MKKPSVKQQADPVERLARLLRECYLAGYVEHNPYHDRPEWREVQIHSGDVWRDLARRLIEKGVKQA